MKAPFYLVFALVLLAVVVNFSSTTVLPPPPVWGTVEKQDVYNGVYPDMSFIKRNATTGKIDGNMCPYDPTIAIWSILTNYRTWFVCTALIPRVNEFLNKHEFWRTRKFADYMTDMRHSGIICGYSKYQMGLNHRFRRGPDINNICLFDQDCNKHCRYDPPELKTDPPHEVNGCGISLTGALGGLCESSGEYALGELIKYNRTYGCNIRWERPTQEQWDDKAVNYAFSIPYTEVRCCYPADGTPIKWRGSGDNEHWIKWDNYCRVTCNYSDQEDC